MAKKGLLASLFSILVLTGSTFAADEDPPLPERLKTAKTVYLVDAAGHVGGFKRLYTEVKKWGRFEVVDSPEKADILLSIGIPRNFFHAGSVSTVNATTIGGVTTGTVNTYGINVDLTEVHLIALDPRTATILWHWGEVRGLWIKSGVTRGMEQLRLAFLILELETPIISLLSKESAPLRAKDIRKKLVQSGVSLSKENEKLFSRVLDALANQKKIRTHDPASANSTALRYSKAS